MNATDSQLCKQCANGRFNQWRMRAARMRDELRRHKITDCERRLAEAILDITFAWGRESVIVPELKYFCAMTGMEKPHVHDAISGLHLQRIIRVVRIGGQLVYSIREDSDNWKASPRELMFERDERMKQLRLVNSLDADDKTLFFRVKPVAKKTGAGVSSQVTHGVIAQEEILPALE